MEARDLEKKAATEAVIMLGYSNMKELQIAMIVSFVMGRDHFSVWKSFLNRVASTIKLEV